MFNAPEDWRHLENYAPNYAGVIGMDQGLFGEKDFKSFTTINEH